MITTSTARIEVRATQGSAWADVTQSLGGYAAVVKFTPKFGGVFCLAHRKNDPDTKALIILPSAEWQRDLADDEWIVDQQILP
jgi:hypothetical protein